jgi:hypothetical protein
MFLCEVSLIPKKYEHAYVNKDVSWLATHDGALRNTRVGTSNPKNAGRLYGRMGRCGGRMG